MRPSQIISPVRVALGHAHELLHQILMETGSLVLLGPMRAPIIAFRVADRDSLVYISETYLVLKPCLYHKAYSINTTDLTQHIFEPWSTPHNKYFCVIYLCFGYGYFHLFLPVNLQTFPLQSCVCWLNDGSRHRRDVRWYRRLALGRNVRFVALHWHPQSTYYTPISLSPSSVLYRYYGGSVPISSNSQGKKNIRIPLIWSHSLMWILRKPCMFGPLYFASFPSWKS